MGRGILWRCMFSLALCAPKKKGTEKVFFSLLARQVDLETRPRSILEEKKDTGLN